MSIDKVNISSTSLDQSYAIQKQDQISVGRNAQTSSSSQASNDSVSLSSTAKDVDRFSGLVGQERQERIGQVQKMMGAGSYNIPATDIAQKLISSNWK